MPLSRRDDSSSRWGPPHRHSNNERKLRWEPPNFGRNGMMPPPPRPAPRNDFQGMPPPPRPSAMGPPRPKHPPQHRQSPTNRGYNNAYVRRNFHSNNLSYRRNHASFSSSRNEDPYSSRREESFAYAMGNPGRTNNNGNNKSNASKRPYSNHSQEEETNKRPRVKTEGNATGDPYDEESVRQARGLSSGIRIKMEDVEEEEVQDNNNQRVEESVGSSGGGRMKREETQGRGVVNRRNEDNASRRIKLEDNDTPSNKDNSRGVAVKSEREVISVSDDADDTNKKKPSRASVKFEPEDNVITIDDDTDDEVTYDDEDEVQELNETHIVLVVDFSTSMCRKDVRTSSGTISRWDAVFESVNELVDEQLASISNDNDGVVLFSMVIFNDDSQTILERMPLTGDGNKLRHALKKARREHKPKGGTGFAAGLGRAKHLLTGRGGRCIVVFLSDGRPGDLKAEPPKDSSIPMQTTFRRKKVEYPAAGTHIEEMKAEFGDKFNLQLICLSSEGRPWLQYLGERYGGVFHQPDMTMDDSNARQSAKSQNSDDEDDDDDEVMDVKVKSQNTLIRERYSRAQASGNVFSIPSTSIRATFQSISSTVTSMRAGAIKRPLQERQIVMEKGGKPSQMRSFPATRMVLKASGDGLQNASGEKSNQRIVKIATQPFAQGGLRNVFRMKEIGQFDKVGKESRHEIDDKERCKFHVETSRCQARTAEYARKFNRSLEKHNVRGVGRIDVICAEVYRLKDPDFPRGYRYLGVEKELKGKYQKYNSNNGFVLDSDTPECQVAQAFSHFSYEESNQKEMVVDVQGSGYSYTDPQLHSKDKEYGRADRGESGFQDFFRTHKCNSICKILKLKKGC